MARGVTVAGVDIGGESRGDAETALHSELDPRAEHPVQVQAGDVKAQIVPADAGLAVDWTATLDRAEGQPLNPFKRVASFFTTDEVGVASTRDDQTLRAAIDELRPQTDRATREGNIVFEGVDPVAVSPSPGQNLDGEGAADALAENWVVAETVELPVEQAPVTVTQEAVDKAMAEVAVPAASADLVVNGRDNSKAVLQRDQVGAVLSFAPDGEGGLEPRFANDAAIGILAPQLVGTEVQPKDASVTLDGGSPSVVPAVVGDLVDWPKTLENLPDLLTRTHHTDAAYGPVPPALTTEAAHGLGIEEVIGEFSTGDFSDASGHNIRLAASEINGALVKPGDTFSLNGYTGTRGTAQGYVESGIINNGRPDKAVGGGVSQVATTLYNAAYFAGMDDVDHTEHSYYISRYPEAREATVFEGAIDLKFKNPAKTGVMIQAIGGSSELTIRIWGTKTVDVDSITGDRTNPTQPDTVTLPAGDHCVASTGSPGFTASDTRVITDHNSGSEISRNTRTVKYDPVPTVKCIGGDESPTAASKPEADEPGAADRPRGDAPKNDEPTTSAPAPRDDEDE
ncbi:VanW family protein [Rhodococcus sp. NPDC058521]|uniref:VanW family protein n=1 Tax=Rhodococcus sp. NPDC058521 TaxID=3346536 RepID=UPI0036533B3C